MRGSRFFNRPGAAGAGGDEQGRQGQTGRTDGFADTAHAASQKAHRRGISLIGPLENRMKKDTREQAARTCFRTGKTVDTARVVGHDDEL